MRHEPYPPSYTEEFKRNTVRLVETSGKSKTQIVRDLAISDSALYRWLKECVQDSRNRAEQVTREALALVVRLRARFWATLSLSTRAGPIAAKGDPERAACLLGACEALLEELGVSQQKGDRIETDHYIAAVRAQLDEATFAAAWDRGRAMSPEEAIDLALQ